MKNEDLLAIWNQSENDPLKFYDAVRQRIDMDNALRAMEDSEIPFFDEPDQPATYPILVDRVNRAVADISKLSSEPGVQHHNQVLENLQTSLRSLEIAGDHLSLLDNGTTVDTKGLPIGQVTSVKELENGKYEYTVTSDKPLDANALLYADSAVFYSRGSSVLAWLIELDQLSDTSTSENEVWENARTVVFEKPFGPYAACSTPLLSAAFYEQDMARVRRALSIVMEENEELRSKEAHNQRNHELLVEQLTVADAKLLDYFRLITEHTETIEGQKKRIDELVRTLLTMMDSEIAIHTNDRTTLRWIPAAMKPAETSWDTKYLVWNNKFLRIAVCIGDSRVPGNQQKAFAAYDGHYYDDVVEYALLVHPNEVQRVTAGLKA